MAFLDQTYFDQLMISLSSEIKVSTTILVPNFRVLARLGLQLVEILLSTIVVNRDIMH